jgi:histidine triad (HIT) family protein
VGPLFLRARSLAVAVEEGMEADGTFMAINNRVSQSVPHLHIHVVPRRKKDGLRGFFWPRLRYESPDSMRDAQSRIRAALERQGRE